MGGGRFGRRGEREWIVGFGIWIIVGIRAHSQIWILEDWAGDGGMELELELEWSWRGDGGGIGRGGKGTRRDSER